MFSEDIYIQRREELSKAIGHGVVLFLGNEEQGLNYRDNTFRFRQDSSFLYYFGISRPHLAAIIDIDLGRTAIFGDELTMDDIVWTGPVESLRYQAFKVGVRDVLPFKPCLYDCFNIVNKQGRVTHFLPPYRPEHVQTLSGVLQVAPENLTPSLELIKAVAAQRNHKAPEEIREIEKACDVTAKMHLAAMKMVRPGLRESEVVAKVEAEARRWDCELSFKTIATVNGQTLHNHSYDGKLRDGNLFLLDAGAEAPSGYCGDMSSTMPVSGKFTSRQRDIYDLQVAMHLKAVSMLKPGVPYEDVYDQSSQVMVEGLKDLGLMKGDAADAVREGAHAMFFPCGLGHLMGLDAHDMENLGEVWVGHAGKPKSTQFGRKSLRLGAPLEPGFVLTVEPGIYFIPQLIGRWKAEGRFTDFINYDALESWMDFSGVRNEEDYLITKDGARRLGKYIPLRADEVEAIMS